MLETIVDVCGLIGKHVPSFDYHAVGIAFVMGYVMIVPMGVSHLLCLLFGAVSYVLLLPQDHEPAAKKWEPDEAGGPAEAPSARDTATPQQQDRGCEDTFQQQAAERRGRAATPQAQATAPPPKAATAPPRWRASAAAAGADRASADDNWRSRRTSTPPWESRRQHAAAKVHEEKVALSSGLSAARRVLAKEAA